MTIKAANGFITTCDDPDCAADAETAVFIDTVSTTYADAAQAAKKRGFDVRNGKTICSCCKGE